MEVTSASRPIIILGPERSGTSVVAEMVHRWGAYAGRPQELRSPDGQNPLGYWEYTPIWRFLEQLGELDRGTSWWRPSFQKLIAHRLAVSQYAHQARQMVAAMETGRPWMWKDPALCFFLPFWTKIWQRPIFVITVRNPYDTALSWYRFVMAGHAETAIDPVPANLLRWQYMMLLILNNTPATAPAIYVAYEELVQRPMVWAQRLCRFLHRATGTATESPDRIQSMADAVHPELWHQRTRSGLRAASEATADLKALYRFLRKRIKRSTVPFVAKRHQMPDGWETIVEEQEATLRRLRSRDEGGYTRRE